MTKGKTKKIVEKKEIRRGSLISPYGVGAIVPFGTDESVMIGSLDNWRYPDKKQGNAYIDDRMEKYIINDERLIRRLGVKELRLPPDKPDVKYNNFYVPAVRFPSTFYCPKCGHVIQQAYRKGAGDSNEVEILYGETPRCPTCNIPMKPDRFVVVCPHGHVTDFPIERWVHAMGEPKERPECHDREHIKRFIDYSPGYGEDVYYKCETCGAKVGMVTAVGRGHLAKINYKCTGLRPWMGQKSNEECSCTGKDLMVIPKGSSNLFFPVVFSSIYLPTKEKVVLDADLIAYLDSQADDVSLKIMAQSISQLRYNGMYTPDEILAAYKSQKKEAGIKNQTEDGYRYQEYQCLTVTTETEDKNAFFYCENKSIDDYDLSIREYFSSISRLHKLKETRAFVGFSRLEPLAEYDIPSLKKLLSPTDVSWLPAIQVYGEGIFIEFNKEKLASWASREDVQARVKLMNKGFHSVTMWSKEGNLKPEFVLLHTFAHLLINQLSYDCGYGSSSIREKIYCEKSGNTYQMNGILIYTASSDSEGSLGGLVKQGQPDYIENTIIAALKNAAWCASDPICIESKGQGMNSCNLAACHNCTLLPETSCENMNCLLDRGVVIGTLDNPELGFFNNLITSC